MRCIDQPPTRQGHLAILELCSSPVGPIVKSFVFIILLASLDHRGKLSGLGVFCERGPCCLVLRKNASWLLSMRETTPLHAH